MSLYKPNITKTSPADRKKLERASALALPTNPTARGMTADQIKAALWTPIFGSDVSLLKELDRVVDAVNSYLLHLYTFLENGIPGTGGGGSDTESVKVHNTDPASHADIRKMIQKVSDHLQAIANSDDITLDQLSEIVAFIKDNKTLIERITTEKVNVSDIIDDLETNLSNKPLSAKQGVVLKGLIDVLTTNKLNASALEPAIAQVLLDAQEQVNAHNTSEESHADLRLLISDYYRVVKSLLDSDDETLNQTSEIVGYIKDNRGFIDAITTSKVNVLDIVDNLTTNASNKPLSAKQGVALKGMVDQLSKDKLSTAALSAAITQALTEAKNSGEFDGAKGDDGKTAYQYAQDGGYTGTEAEFATKLAEQSASKQINAHDTNAHAHEDIREQIGQISADNDRRALRVDEVFAPSPQLPADGRKIGDNLGGGEKIPNFTNLIASDFSNVQLNKRISSSGSVKDATGNICFTDQFSVLGGGTFYINLPQATVDTNYTRFWMYNDNGTMLNTDAIPSDTKHGVTLSESNGVTGITIPSYWNGANVYYVKINLYIKSTAVTTADIADLVVSWKDEITYTEPDGEIATENADFDVGSIVAKDIFDYIKPIAEKYPNYVTREILGKDASGKYDYHRYTLCKHYYSAWCRRNYPKMFAWKNGSTVIYSVSVSPRVGDTMYSTKYIGTAYGTVASVNCSAQGSATMLPSTRTVGEKIFTREETSDVEPTLVYTSTISEIVNGSWVKPEQVNATIYGLGGTKLARVSASDTATITSNHTTPIVYDRYPMGDVNSKWVKPTTITIWANEHQDTPEPAIIMARFIKDLCENTNNKLLRYIKNNLMLVIIPVANPYGFSWRESCDQYGDGYYNVNGVNINRNFDTPGWANGPYDTGTGALGVYGGSEIETQYLMNSLHLSNAVVGMSLHTVGYMNADETVDNPASNGLCHYQGNGFDVDKIAEIAEFLRANYNLQLTDYGTADPTTTGKSPAYITYAGCIGGLVEMQPREAIDNPQGTDGSPMVMESCYAEFLQFLAMWLTDAAE